MIAVVDYGMGNLHSVVKALEAAGAESVLVTSRSDDLQAAERIVLPGVGAFGDGIKQLRETGVIDTMDREVRGKGKPFLGICLGMQLLAEEGLENGRHAGLGWIRGTVQAIEPRDPSLKVPHMGWDDVYLRAESPLFRGIGRSPVFYFAHSFRFETAEDPLVIGICEYGEPFPAVIQQGNILATQFHPEKSQVLGLRFIRNFLSWVPTVHPASHNP